MLSAAIRVGTIVRDCIFGLEWTVVEIESAEHVEIERGGLIVPVSIWELCEPGRLPDRAWKQIV